MENLLHVPWSIIKISVSKFINELKEGNLYKLSSISETTLLSTTFALLIQKSFNYEIDKNVIDVLKNSQVKETGLFLDGKIKESNLSNEKKSYLINQTTYFSRLILRELNIDFEQINDSLIPSYINVESWIDSFNWDFPWDCSNDIMFVLDFCFNIPTNKKKIEIGKKILDVLAKRQNIESGLWGTNRASLLASMSGSMHFYPFFIKFYGEVPYSQKIINSVFSLQKSGFFYPLLGGGVCPDYDGIASLVWLNACSDRGTIALVSAFSSLFSSLTNEGLFIEAKRLIGEQPPNDIEDKVKDWMLSDIHKYSGWHSMKYTVSKPNLWACYLRSISLATIQQFLVGKTEIFFNNSCGLGWYNK